MSLINDLKRYEVINNFFYGVKESETGEFVQFEQASNLYNIKCKELGTVRENLINSHKKILKLENEKASLIKTLNVERRDTKSIIEAANINRRCWMGFSAFLAILLIFNQLVKLIEFIL